MLKSSFFTYISQDNEDILYADSGVNFSMIVEVQDFEIEEKEDRDKWFEIFSQILQRFNTSHIESLAHFEELIYQSFKEHNVPIVVSAVFTYLKNEVLYLKTMGMGSVFLKRDRNFAKLIDGDNCASGFVKENDSFILTTANFVESINGEEELKKYVNENKDLKSSKKGLALVLKFTKDIIQNKYSEIKKPIINHYEQSSPKINLFNRLKSLFNSIRLKQQTSGSRKTITLIMVVFISLVLVWSVGFGYKRRVEEQQKAKILKVKELIEQKLNSADDVSFLNMARAQSFIDESHDEFIKLKTELKNGQKDQIKNLEDYINKRKGEILKMDEKKPEEFFDLTVDQPQAKGSKFYLYGDTFAVLNNDGIIYLLSISKKSLDKQKFAEIKKAQSIALYEGKIFFYSSGEGIFKVEDGKLKKIVENDPDWGNIIDMNIYNGNIYLLDQGKNDVYKYLSTDGGYSAKKSYFGQGESMTLDNPNSFAIDQSIYIASNKIINKYTGGVRDGFTVSFPNESFNLHKVYTSRDIDKVIAWDKNKGVIYIMTKSGSYEKQLVSGLLKKADDIVAYDNNIYIIFSSKIYKISF